MQEYNRFDQETTIVDSEPTYSRANRRAVERYHGGGLAQAKTFFLYGSGTITVIVIGYGVWTVRAFLPILGVLALVVGIVLLLCLGAYAVVSVVRHATRADFYPVEENGAYLRDSLGRVRPLAPMIAAPARVNQKTAKVEITPVVPSLFDLIEDGTIQPGRLEMVMGYDKVKLEKGILQVVMGPWPGTFAVAGKGRSGKTRRVIAIVIQALIALAPFSDSRVIICDPHATKPDSLARELAPIEQYLTIARGEKQIVEQTKIFSREMEARVSGISTEYAPWVIIFDEWSRLMDANNSIMPEGGRDLLADVATNCSTQYAGYQGFAGLIGQKWTQDSAGGTDIRRSLQSVFVHQLSPEFAAFFFKAAKWKNKAEEIKRRECIFRDVENEVSLLVTVNVPDDSAIRANSYLASIGASYAQEANKTPHELHPGRATETPLDYLSLPAPARDLSTENTPVRERDNQVNEPVEQYESCESVTLKSESFTVESEPVTFTSEQESAVLLAAFQIARESNGKITRSDIKERLGWNNRGYPVIKAVCDKHNIAKQ